MPATRDCAQPTRVHPIGEAKIRNIHHDAVHERSSVRGIVRFLLWSAGYVIVFLGTAAAPGLGLKLIGSCLLFLIIFHMALLAHDAGHGSLTRCASLNRWFGRLALLVNHLPFSGWLAHHSGLHHAYTNLRGKDPVWAPLSKQDYDGLSRVQQALERFSRTILGVTFKNILVGLSIVLFPERSLFDELEA